MTWGLLKIKTVNSTNVNATLMRWCKVKDGDAQLLDYKPNKLVFTSVPKQTKLQIKWNCGNHKHSKKQ